jgi:hypothetical protein
MSFNLDPIGDPLFDNAVSLADLKKHMRVSQSADDSYIIDILEPAATQQVETDFNVKLVGQNYDLHLENGFYHFYYEQLYVPLNTHVHWTPYYPKFHIPIQPVNRNYPVVITYTDLNDATQTFASSNYTVKYWADPPEIMLNPAVALPSIKPATDIVVNFTAGYATADVIPKLYKQAIQILVSTWFENREGTSETLVRTIPLAYDRIKALTQIKRFK